MTLRRPPTSYLGTIRSRSRIGLEAPTTSSPPAGRARATAPATSYGVRSASAREQRVERAAPTRRSAARHAVEPGGVVGCLDDRPGLEVLRRPGTAARSRRPARHGRAPRRRRAAAAASPGGTAWGGRTPRPARPRRPSGAVEQQPVAAERGRRPCGDPLVGSANSGQPRPLRQHPRRRAGVVAGDHDGARAERAVSVRLAGSRDRRQRAFARPATGRTSQRSLGTSGSSSWTLRCSGPSPSPSAVVRDGRVAGAEVDVRHERAEDADLVGGLVGAGAAQPGGPVGGHGDSRTPACAASSIAGCRLATAVPEVQITAAWLPTLVSPRARKPAERSSMRVCSRTQPGGRGVVRRERQRGVARAGSDDDLADAGLDQRRDDGPGQLGRGRSRATDPAAPHVPRPAGPASAPRARGSPRSAPAAPRRPRDGAPAAYAVDRQQPVRRRRRRPAAARSRGPHAYGSSGSAAASATPGGEPDRRLQRRRDDDRQPDVLGDPQAGPHPAERLHLEHRDVGRLEVAHPVGVGRPPDRLVGGDRDVDAAGAPRPAPRPSAHGCSTYSSPPAARSSAGSRATASSTSQAAVGVDPDPAARAERVAHRLEPGLVVGEGWPWLGDLDLGGRGSPTGAHDRVGVLGRDRGHGHVDRDPVAHRLRPVARGRLLGAAQPGSAPRRRRTPGTGSTRPSRRRRGCSIPSRTVMPRKRVRIGIEKTRTSVIALTPAARRRSTLPLASSGSASSDDQLARRPRPRVHAPPPSRGPRRARGRRPPRRPRAGPTRRRARRPPRRRSPPGARAAGRRRRRCGTLTPPLITMSSSRPSTWSRPSSSNRPASAVRNQPSTSTSAVSAGSPSYPSNSVGPPIRIRPSAPIATATPSSGSPS